MLNALERGARCVVTTRDMRIVVGWFRGIEVAHSDRAILVETSRGRTEMNEMSVKQPVIKEAMRIGGRKVETPDVVEVRYPYTNEVIGTVPAGNAEHAREAFEIAAGYNPKLSTTVTQLALCDSQGNKVSVGGVSAARGITISATGRPTATRDVAQITTILSSLSTTCP